MDLLKFKEYEGTAEIDVSRGVCRGKILFIQDLVTYEAPTPAELRTEFEAAVDDYLETCAAVGKEPAKPFKGSFNVRVDPALHRAAALRAIADDISLNEIMGRALAAYVQDPVTVRAHVDHTVHITLEQPTEGPFTAVSVPEGSPRWEVLRAH